MLTKEQLLELKQCLEEGEMLMPEYLSEDQLRSLISMALELHQIKEEMKHGRINVKLDLNDLEKWKPHISSAGEAVSHVDKSTEFEDWYSGAAGNGIISYATMKSDLYETWKAVKARMQKENALLKDQVKRGEELLEYAQEAISLAVTFTSRSLYGMDADKLGVAIDTYVEHRHKYDNAALTQGGING